MSAKLTLAEARAILKRAVEKSIELKWISAFAIVDEGGNLISASRVDGAPASAMDVARSKAYIAAVTCRDTQAFADRMEAHPVRFAGFQQVLPYPLFPGPGGVPIVKYGRCVGGFSSSLSSHQGGMKVKVGNEMQSREDAVTAYALQIPYVDYHKDMG